MASHARYPKWMGEWLSALSIGMGAMDEATWAPFDIFRLFPYFSDLAIERAKDAYDRIEERKVAPISLAKKLNSPQVTRIEAYLGAFELKASGLHKSGIGPQLYGLYDRILRSQCQRDFYGVNSSYVHTNKELGELAQKTPWQNGTPEHGREIGRLINSLSQLSWSLYSDYFYPNSYKNLGPYTVNLEGKKTLIVREYTDCKPVDLWPESRRNPVKHVKILTAYNPRVGIGMDWIEHIYSKGSLPQNLSHFAIWADGKWIPMEEAVELRRKLEQIAGEQFERFSNLGFEEIKKKLLDARYFELRGFYSELGMDWKPSSEMLERVGGKPLLPTQYPKNMGNTQWKA